jgi:hypothetical protein
MNDLPVNIIESKLVLFADDTDILVTAENETFSQHRINRVMNELQL